MVSWHPCPERVRMLVREYLIACAREISAQMGRERSTCVRWKCSFAPNYELLVGVRPTDAAMVMSILAVNPLAARPES